MSINVSEQINKIAKQLEQYKKDDQFMINFGHKLNEDGTVTYYDIVFTKEKRVPVVDKNKVKPVKPEAPKF